MYSKVHDDAHVTIATHRQRRPDQIEVAALPTARQTGPINMVMENIVYRPHC